MDLRHGGADAQPGGPRVDLTALEGKEFRMALHGNLIHAPFGRPKGSRFGPRERGRVKTACALA